MASGQRTAEVHVASDNEPMAATVDWRTKGVVTEVKNQVRELIIQLIISVWLLANCFLRDNVVVAGPLVPQVLWRVSMLLKLGSLYHLASNN